MITKTKYYISQLTIVVLLIFGITTNGYSQGIAINSTGAPPEASTVLDIASINKGFLAPRVTLTGTTDVTTISSAAVSLLVYNTATVSDVTPGYYFWTGTIWKRWLNEDPLDINWELTGNEGTVPTTHFLGTTDNVAMSFRRGNSEKLRLNNHVLEFRNSSRGVYLGEGAAVNHLYPTGSFGSVAIGYEAFKNVTSSSSSVAIGYRALQSVVTSATLNTAIGNMSQASVTTATFNTSIGAYSLYSSTTGGSNAAVGDSAAYSNLTGASITAMGNGAFKNGTGGYSVGIGTGALMNYTSSSTVVAIGRYAAASLTSGTRNIAIGNYALGVNTTSSYNVAIGYEAGYTSNAGNNTFVGYQAGKLVAGSGNVCIGYQAGMNETGSDKLYIDNSSTSTPLISGDFANDRVGINRVATTNTLEISGDASKAAAGNWVANSDSRIKTEIKDVENGIETIMKLHPVKFKYTDEWKERNPHIKANDRYYYNYIAQEYQQVFPNSVKGSGEFLQNDTEEILQVDTYNSQIVAIKAIQEQQELIESQKKILNELKSNVELERKKLNQQMQEVEKLEKTYKELER